MKFRPCMTIACRVCRSGRGVALLDVGQAVVVLGQVLLELGDRVGLLALADPHELLAGQDEVDAAGFLGQPGQLVGGEARGLLVPSVVEAVPLVELEVGGLGPAADQRVVDVVGDRVLEAVVGIRVAEERLAADDVERDVSAA